MRKIAAALAILALVPQFTQANERKFTYTYESGVLDSGQREMEISSTFRNGRATPLNEYQYSEFDHRAELEMGLGGNLMTAFYLNWKKVVAEDTDPTTGAALGTLTSETEFQGISSEWKLKLSDPVADTLGSALYFEAGMEANELELEGKLILDRKFGDILVAYNFVFEKEYAYEPGVIAEEAAIENDLGITNFFTDHFSGGLEMRQHAEFVANMPGADPEHIALFLGPVLSYAGSNWWVTATCLFQLPALQKSTADPGRALVLDEHEKINARLILSWAI